MELFRKLVVADGAFHVCRQPLLEARFVIAMMARCDNNVVTDFIVNHAETKLSLKGRQLGSGKRVRG